MRTPTTARSNKNSTTCTEHIPANLTLSSDTAADIEPWLRGLPQRRLPVALAELAPPGKSSPLLWTLPDELADSDTSRLIRRLSRRTGSADRGGGGLAGELATWLARAEGRSADAGFGLECLAWCHALPSLGCTLSAELWCELFKQLVETAAAAAGIDSAERPLAREILAGELPLSLAYVFPEVDACRRFAAPAGRAISRGIEDLLDGEGLPEWRNLAILRPLLATWTRSALMLAKMKGARLKADARTQYEWLVRQAIRLSRYDGTQALAGGSSGAWCRELFAAALTIADDPDDIAAATIALPGGKTLVPRRGGDLPEEAACSEWAEVAVLRSDWSRQREQLAVTFGGRKIHSELNCGQNTVWTGPCDPLVAIDGRRLMPIGDWEEICWFSDEDVDYLELEISLSDKWRVQRSILLARKDRFLLLADAILGKKSGRIDYHCRLPLCESIGLKVDEKSREGHLVDVGRRKRIGTVLPLAMPEWHAEPFDGSLAMTEEGLLLTQSATARRMFAPLFIDLDARRTRAPLTWRRLTVAESLEIQPGEVAVGYRIQIGHQQWLIYRSLGPTGNRTVLGQNLSSEFFVARFDREGNAEPLMEIE